MDVAKDISEGLARSVIAAEIDGSIVDADHAGEMSTGDKPIALRLLTSRDLKLCESCDILQLMSWLAQSAIIWCFTRIWTHYRGWLLLRF